MLLCSAGHKKAGGLKFLISRRGKGKNFPNISIALHNKLILYKYTHTHTDKKTGLRILLSLFFLI